MMTSNYYPTKRYNIFLLFISSCVWEKLSFMKTLIIGLDAFDPSLFENLYEQGKLQNLGNLLNKGGYARFQVSNPPQSEVSWTSIATGLNPGEHGMFDFVHRDPASYALNVSLLPTGRGLGGVQFLRPYNARTIFDVAAERGFLPHRFGGLPLSRRGPNRRSRLCLAWGRQISRDV